jgi:hypothetical protein
MMDECGQNMPQCPSIRKLKFSLGVGKNKPQRAQRRRKGRKAIYEQ